MELQASTTTGEPVVRTGGVSLIRDVRDYVDYVRREAGRLRASGASADDAAAAIEEGARARWDDWANPEWIGYAARAFHQASPPVVANRV
jgi:hypothetical protein